MPQEISAGLVVFRRADGKPSFLLLRYGFGHWGFPKGNIESGETEKEAAIREAEEETGLTTFRFIDDFKENIKYFYKRKRETVHKEVVYFLAETEEKNVKLSYEHWEYKWLGLDDALKQLSFYNDKEVLKKAWKAIKNSTAVALSDFPQKRCSGHLSR